MPKKRENILYHKPHPSSKSHITILVVFISVIALVFLYYNSLVPTGAQSTCISDADCPTGYYCGVTPMCPTCKACIQKIQTECNDGIDNDGDRFIDLTDDFGCTSPDDNDETNCGDNVCEGGETWRDCLNDCPAPQCSNGIDDDGDGKVDCEDSGCYPYIDCDPNDNDETNPSQQLFDCCVRNLGAPPGSPNSAQCAKLSESECLANYENKIFRYPDTCQQNVNCPVYKCNNKNDDDGDAATDLNDLACKNDPMGQSEKASISCSQACKNFNPSSIGWDCYSARCPSLGWGGPVSEGAADCQDVYRGSSPLCCCRSNV